MKYDLLLITTKEDLERLPDVILKLQSFIMADKIVIAGDGEVKKLFDEGRCVNVPGITYINIDGLNSSSYDDAVINYSLVCDNEYYLAWNINVLPTSRFEAEYDGHPIVDTFDGKVTEHLLIKKSIMQEILEKSFDLSEGVNNLYINYIISNYKNMYMTRTGRIFEAAGKFFKESELTYQDFLWLSKEYGFIKFKENDVLLPEYSFFFHSEDYRKKLLPSQIYDAICAETSECSEDTDKVKSNEFVYSALIEQEIRKGNKIVICPFEEEGRAFKELLNAKYNMLETLIVDNDKAGECVDGIKIISIEELTNLSLDNVTVIVNSDNYEKNLGIVIKIADANIRVTSIYGAYETIVPGRKQFIEKFRELTEVKAAITDKQFVRVGAVNDGGYVMLEDFTPDMKAYSYGINDDVSWDKQIATNYGMDIYMYDHTIDGLPEENVHFNFYKKGVAAIDKPEEKLYSLKTCIKDNGHLENDNLILKMDVEGAEWEVINAADENLLSQFKQIAFELHNLDHPEKEEEILSALEKLNKTHFPVWVHGNNHDNAICTDDIILPISFEILYLNKKHYQYTQKEVLFPWSLDAKNTRVFPEYILGNWGKRTESPKL